MVELDWGITVYPPEVAGEPWRATFTEGGRRRYRQAVSEEKLAARLVKVTERLRAGAPDMERPGADLIAHYLDLDRLPVARRWSRRHADTQRRLCERFAAPVIAAIACQDITVADMQQIVNAAPTAGEGDRLREVHWQAGGRQLPAPRVNVAGESGLWVGPGEIPAAVDVDRLGQALARGRRGDLDELMAATAAYAGLRQGELFALTIGQVDPGAQVITVDRKVIEVAGHLYVELPKGRKHRSAIYPARTPQGYPLAAKLAARAGQARAEREAGANPLGLIFPSPRGAHWRSSNFDRRVLAPAYLAAGWRDDAGPRHLDLAQPAARLLHHRPVHLEARRHRRVPHGRPRQLPHHPRHVRRRHRRHPRTRPQSHPISTRCPDESRAGSCRLWPTRVLATPACSAVEWCGVRNADSHRARTRYPAGQPDQGLRGDVAEGNRLPHVRR